MAFDAPIAMEMNCWLVSGYKKSKIKTRQNFCYEYKDVI